MRSQTLAAACAAACLGGVAAGHVAPSDAHARARIPEPVIHRLAQRARVLHRRPGAHRSTHGIFLVLCDRWRRRHARPAPSEVLPGIRVAARRYGLDPEGMVRVARCESGLLRTAVNGQYLGLFQLGFVARARYLDGDWRDAYANAVAAARYATTAGGFEPWACGFTYA